MNIDIIMNIDMSHEYRFTTSLSLQLVLRLHAHWCRKVSLVHTFPSRNLVKYSLLH